ncbi:MAG: tetratricopeptide repeat protein [Pontiella sp.]|nr:tetratricopeptide repeat protein [Pontiella sp.]
MTESRLSRLDPDTAATSVLLEVTKELLKNDQLEDALPFLKQVLVRLEGDNDKKARLTLAYTLYQLAHCQMKLGEYQSGAANFIRFADEFPDDPQQDSGRVLAAQCLTILEQWPQVAEQVSKVLENPRLASELKVTATQLHAESLYQQEKWREAIKPLTSLFRMARVDTVRAGAAVMLVTSYVRLNDFNNLFRFLPNCDAAARHDVGLNVALLEAGDAHYNAGEYQKALLLYRLVFLKQELIEHYEKRLRDVKSSMKPFAAGGKQTLSDYQEQQRKRQVLFDRLSKHYQVIKNFQDYDMDVALRTAQCYNDLERNWPAHAIYIRLYTEAPDSALADQARFSAFAVMLDEQEWALALAEGYAYVDNQRDGAFLDDVSLNLMQVHMQQEQFDLALDMGQRALKLLPDHKYIDQVKYLMGYVHFLQLDYEAALADFSDILARWPESRYYESAEYWQAMSLLFLGRFAEAETAFHAYLTNPKYDPRVFEEDASYRLGIAQYGAERYAEAEQTFRSFTDEYPESPLLSEAYAMLGDLRGAEGDLTEAIDFYTLARQKALNLSQVNYPLFQMTKVLELEKRYDEIIGLMRDYIEEYGSRGDFANAANWKGKAFKALDQYPRALDAYFEVIEAVGSDTDLTGVDLILNAIITDYKSEEWAIHRDLIRVRLDRHLADAKKSGRRTLELQYQTVFASITEGAEREAFVDAIVQPKNVPAAGPGTLVLIAREGTKRKEYEIVHEATRRFMSNFEISNNMLYILLADEDALVQEGSYDEALELSEEILLKFGYSKSVGMARKRRGDAFRLQGRFEEALEAYKEVLSVREWRGELTPEALYYSGICKMKLGEVEEAFAFFQRIYVLYEEYLQWVAPAYAKSIECLELLGDREQDIINTIEEMLANEAVAATPEGASARKLLGELEPIGSTL